MPKKSIESNKVAIIGCGRVGMTTAFSILHTGVVNELMLFGRDKSKLLGEKLDLEHGVSFLHPVTISISDNYSELADADMIVITAGAAQKPGETRLELAQKNIEIIEYTINQLVKHTLNATVLIVSNPVDVLTYRAYKLAGFPKGQIFGSGTVLDTARFRFHLSEFLGVNPRSIHAYVMGEHGDSSFPVLSSATVGSQPLTEFPNFSETKAKEAYQKARDAAYKIIESKGATYYGIAAVVTNLVKAVLSNAKTVLPVSIPLHDFYGHSGVALSVPYIIGRRGVETVLRPKLNWEEKQALEKSVNTLKQFG
ncbi:MAG TPA: L-lactate dehydrogenase [Candidatus Woesebacteria bacterium]|nr:L-lactate dehydrogenase [Candidatus Woesebacteria bacterium]